MNRDRLASAYLLAGSLAARPGSRPRSPSRIPRRAGAVQEAVIQVLAMAEQAFRACEIHVAAQELAGIPLSWNTVKDCLHTNARRPGSPIDPGEQRQLPASLSRADVYRGLDEEH